MATASSSRSSVRGVIEAAIVVCVLVVGVLSNRPASVPLAAAVIPAKPTPLAEEWRMSTAQILRWTQSGELLLVAGETSLIAVDSRTGEVKWEVPGAQEVVFVSTDGYTLTVTVGDSTTRGVWTWSWIDPNGVVLWQAASEWRSGPVVTPEHLVGLRLDKTIAAANGVLVAESQNEGPGSSVAAIASDGTQLWRVAEARAPYDWFESTPRHAASYPVAVLPPTVVVDIGDPADVATVSLATLDIATGAQTSAFPVIDGNQPDGIPVQVHRQGSWVVWWVRQADPSVCDWHGRNVDNTAEWQTTLPCSLGYTFGAAGRIVGMTKTDGTGERALVLDVTTGEWHEEDWSGDRNFPLLTGEPGPLSGVSIDDATVTAYSIDTGAEAWSRELDVTRVLSASELRGIVAAAGATSSADHGWPATWVTLLRSDSGQIIAQYPAPADDVQGVFALDEHRFFVVGTDFVGVYSVPTG